MAQQEYVDRSIGPRFIGDVFPTSAENGDTFLYTDSKPKSLYVWDGNPGAGRWIFWGYLREVNYPVIPPEPGGVSVGGYALGGLCEEYISFIQKLQFSNENVFLVTSTLSQALHVCGGVTSSPAGYAGGGNVGPTTFSHIDKLLFSTEAVSLLSTNLRKARTEPGTFESNSKGYFCCGSTAVEYYGDAVSLTFSTETTAYVVSTYSIPRYTNGGFASTSRGYIAGGAQTVPTVVNYIERLTFSNESIVLISSRIAVARGHLAGLSAIIYGVGYTGGGRSDINLAYYSIIDRLAFSNESTMLLSSTLTKNAMDPAFFQMSTAGYISGGSDGTDYTSVINKLWFGTESVASLATSLLMKTFAPGSFENPN